jgi:hypothetical protein
MRNISFLAMILSADPTMAGDLYRDNARHFQFRILDGWFQMSKAEVDAINAAAKSMKVDRTPHYIAGFRRIGSNGGATPYILVQEESMPAGGGSWEELEEAIGKDLQRPLNQFQRENPGFFKSLDVNNAWCDRENNRIIMRVDFNTQGGGKSSDASFMHIGKNHIIAIHGYEQATKFEAALPAFEKFSEGFRFDDGYQFQPSAAAPCKVDLLQVAQWGVIGGCVAGFMGAVATMVFRKKKPVSSERDWNSLL